MLEPEGAALCSEAVVGRWRICPGGQGEARVRVLAHLRLSGQRCPGLVLAQLSYEQLPQRAQSLIFALVFLVRLRVE